MQLRLNAVRDYALFGCTVSTFARFARSMPPGYSALGSSIERVMQKHAVLWCCTRRTGIMHCTVLIWLVKCCSYSLKVSGLLRLCLQDFLGKSIRDYVI